MESDILDKDTFADITSLAADWTAKLDLLDTSIFESKLKRRIDETRDDSTEAIFKELLKSHGIKGGVAEVSRMTGISKDSIWRMLDGSTCNQQRWHQLVIGMQLSLEEADRLMQSAGRSLSLSTPAGLLTTTALLEHKYDYEELNAVLTDLYTYMRVPPNKRDPFDIVRKPRW